MIWINLNCTLHFLACSVYQIASKVSPVGQAWVVVALLHYTAAFYCRTSSNSTSRNAARNQCSLKHNRWEWDMLKITNLQNVPKPYFLFPPTDFVSGPSSVWSQPRILPWPSLLQYSLGSFAGTTNWFARLMSYQQLTVPMPIKTGIKCPLFQSSTSLIQLFFHTGYH